MTSSALTKTGRGMRLSEFPPPNTNLYRLMHTQIHTASLCYHFMRAGLMGRFEVETSREESLENLSQFSFPEYHEYPLPARTVRNAKSGEEEATKHLQSIAVSLESWQIREMGPMGVVQEVDMFLTMMLYFHGKLKTTGSESWDNIFGMVQRSRYDKRIIPCMFFGSAQGCLNPACGYMHKPAVVSSIRRDILDDRRKTLNKPTGKQLAKEKMELWIEYVEQHPEKVDAKDVEKRIKRLPPSSRKYCANPQCSIVWSFKDPIPNLEMCGRCLWTFYCSRKCQKIDWPRHKAEPCAPADEIIENDALWAPNGKRKGTELDIIFE
ncbi:hypothetical protein BD410DRAFT_897807 [Rickenella mellea]|uniref:MYND-type domain-containing protein n=1 Tax=Rickenella mellea TaxID=50990 RepID=A0A4Y7Q5T2_9AGAM|nr:hypothetical protein BD410DRAFT_897807 [Rickenella mellea]